MLNSVEHEKSFITLRPGSALLAQTLICPSTYDFCYYGKHGFFWFCIYYKIWNSDLLYKAALTLKRPIMTAADDSLEYFFIVFLIT